MHVWIIVRSQSTGSSTATSSKLFTVWRTGATFHKQQIRFVLLTRIKPVWKNIENDLLFSQSPQFSRRGCTGHTSGTNYKSIFLFFVFQFEHFGIFNNNQQSRPHIEKKTPGARSVVLHRLQHLDGGREPVEGGHHQQRDRWRGVHLELVTSLSPLLPSSAW